MMKLLKYDFKRNTSRLLGVMAVLILVQVSIMLFIENNMLLTWLTIFAYIIAGVFLFITPIRTFSYNLKAYHRKLLPVHTLKSILSPIVMGGGCLLILGFVAAIHGYVYLSAFGHIEIIMDQIRMYPLDTIMTLFSVFWMIIHVLITIFLAITIAASIRRKGSFWIGIVSFFLIVNGLTWIESKFFGEYNGGLIRIFSVEFDNAASGMSTNTDFNSMYFSGNSIGMFIFELICSIAFLYIMVKLIDRKVEV
ncbi:hypothetical protein ACP8HI_02455 [Paenibacillus sp. FA6]|uniref:hypothetical protein n=1 Tax=Paenibacillus sp. FA6 TaxID=3413029 RepID=UPI003F6602EE